MGRFSQSRCFAYVLLAALGGSLFFPNLGAHGLWELDEAHNAQCAREMRDADNWRIPTFNFQLRTDKPALVYWMMGLAYGLFGVTEFAARFFSAVAGIGTMLATYELGRRLFAPAAGLLAAAILGSTVMFSVSSHAATPDAQLLFWTTLSMLVFWTGYVRGSRNWLLFYGVTTGMAVLAKGPVGLVLPAAAITLFLVSQGRLRWLACKRFLVGSILFGLVVVPWYAVVSAETHGEFFFGFFMQHNLSRFSQAMEGHRGPVFYHLLVLPLAFAPWSAFLPAAAWYGWGRRARLEATDAERREHENATVGRAAAHGLCAPLRFVWCWIGVWVVFFSLSSTKLPNYVLPAYPALALLVGRFLYQWGVGEVVPARGWVIWSVGCLALAGMAASSGLAMVGGWIPAPLPLAGKFPELGPLALVGTILVAAAWWAWRWRGRPVKALAGVAGGCVMFTALLAALAPRLLSDRQVAPALARTLRAEQVPELRLATWGCYHPAVVFYTNTEMRRLSGARQAADWLADPQRVYLIVPAKRWTELEPAVHRTCTIVCRRHDPFLDREVLLIANRALQSERTAGEVPNLGVGRVDLLRINP